MTALTPELVLLPEDQDPGVGCVWKGDRVITKCDFGPFILLTGVELGIFLRVANDIPVQETDM